MQEWVSAAVNKSSSDASVEDKNDVPILEENGNITGPNGAASTDLPKESGTKG